MIPLPVKIVLEEITANPHEKLVALRRGFKWEVVKQLVEDYWVYAVPMEEVKGDREIIYPEHRMVLQFKQGRFYYRLAFDLYLKSSAPTRQCYTAEVMTIFHGGKYPALDCDVQVLDGTYDLPTEKVK